MRRETFELVRRPFIWPHRDENTVRLRDLSVSQTSQKQRQQAYTEIITKFREIVAPALQDDSVNGLLVKILDITRVGVTLPRIDSQTVTEYLQTLEEHLHTERIQHADTGTAAIAALIVQLQPVLWPNDILASVTCAEAIRLEMASYTSWLNIVEAETNNAAFSESLKELHDRYRTGTTEIESRLSDFNSRALELQSRDVRLRESLDQATLAWHEQMKTSAEGITANEATLSKISGDFEQLEKRVDSGRSNIDAFKTTILEEVRGRETRKLWLNRDAEAWKAFWISAWLLATLLVGIPGLGLMQLDWVLGILRHIGEATTEGIPKTEGGTLVTVATISRLFVITFPLVLYLWVIRLVVRFNARSLALHDDARQRQTMLDTYFILLEREAATTEERGLILNALFRPGPGQGPENLEPPTFADFVGKANPVK